MVTATHTMLLRARCDRVTHLRDGRKKVRFTIFNNRVRKGFDELPAGKLVIFADHEDNFIAGNTYHFDHIFTDEPTH